MKNNKKAQYFPISALREDLRLRAAYLASRLERSVGRLTSCDALPCEEYGEEVKTEYALAEKILYLQNTRNALEQCIAKGAASLRFRWSGGAVTVTHFKKIGPNRVKAYMPPLPASDTKGADTSVPQGRHIIKN